MNDQNLVQMILESFCGVCEVQDVDRMSITLDLVKWNGLNCTSREGRPRVGSIPREDLMKRYEKYIQAIRIKIIR